MAVDTPAIVVFPVPDTNDRLLAPLVDPIVIRFTPALFAPIATVFPPVPPARVRVHAPFPAPTSTAFVADDEPIVIVPV